MSDYWSDRCHRCSHTRGHHGEGGCTASVVGRNKCGCKISQSAIPKREKK